MNSQRNFKFSIKGYDNIFIDTCALMNTYKLRKLIQSMRNDLLKQNKKIIVIEEVCLELARLIDDENPIKGAQALNAIEIIAQNKELFDVENQNLKESQISEAFADPKILAELIVNRSQNKQLLITADKNLGKDTQYLNELQSCHGQNISACYVDDDGNLKRFKCEEKKEPEVRIVEIVKEVKVVEEKIIVEQVEAPKENKWMVNFVMSALTLGVGYTFGKHGDEIVKFARTFNVRKLAKLCA